MVSDPSTPDPGYRRCRSNRSFSFKGAPLLPKINTYFPRNLSRLKMRFLDRPNFLVRTDRHTRTRRISNGYLRTRRKLDVPQCRLTLPPFSSFPSSTSSSSSNHDTASLSTLALASSHSSSFLTTFLPSFARSNDQRFDTRPLSHARSGIMAQRRLTSCGGEG